MSLIWILKRSTVAIHDLQKQQLFLYINNWKPFVENRLSFSNINNLLWNKYDHKNANGVVGSGSAAAAGGSKASNDQDHGKDMKAKIRNLQKITLVTQNHGITITTLDDAMKLAKRRDLQLVLVQEMDKAQRPVYKLVTQGELLEDDVEEPLKNSPNESHKDKILHKKSEKQLTLGSRIAEHDLASRLKNITKWLTKQHEVKILIQGSNSDDMANCERIAKTIEQNIKEPMVIGKIVQKRTKGLNMKFNIVPINATANASTPTGTSNIGDLKSIKKPS